MFGMSGSSWWADVVDWLVLALVGLSGLAFPDGAGAWYGAFGACFLAIAGPVLAGAGLVTWLATRVGRPIQWPRRGSALIPASARDTARAAFVAAGFAAWPLALLRAQRPTGLEWSLARAGGLGSVVVQTLLALLVIDAWLYWKHRLLHTRFLFPFHRDHHVYRDPTPFAGFAVGPVESVLTFWPILLLCIPAATHWAPLYFGLIGSFVALNFYLHSGVTLRWVEATLPRLYINTSAFHNLHHAHADRNFGEAFTIWDRLLRTGRV